MRGPTFYVALVALSFSFPCALAQSSTTAVLNAFKAANLIPDVIPSFTPNAILDITYTDESGKNLTVTPGSTLTVNQTAHRPQFALTSNNASLAGKPFVLVMFDPDAPTPKNRSLSQIRHLVASVQLASDISTTVLTSTAGAPLSNSTPAVWDYLSPGPPPGSDPHRYTLLLFDQPATFVAAVPRFVNASSPVTGFDVRAFAKALDLGAPIAGNFFLTGPVGGSNSSSTSTTKSGKSSARGSVDVHVGAIAFGVSVAAAAFGSALL